MTSQAAVKGFAGKTENIDTPEQQRIRRLRDRYQNGPAYISVERAKYYTESWKDTEGKGWPLP
jgi:hypothetical protein